MQPKPTNLSQSILWTLAIMPVSADADFQTKTTHKELRKQFGMNPDIRKRGDASETTKKGREMANTQLIQKNVRMNDYVGIGRFATVTWSKPCTREGGFHHLGLLGPSCVCCGAVPKVDYETPIYPH